ncbi:MAG TPA: ABC transporter permease [Acidimicrobiales bacterium]|nr:ABC transporter permease [Acidimicrobiales bacterium]
MHAFFEFTVIGLVLGAAYAVAACGLVVTYSTSGIFNIAHGAIGMFMAFTYWQLTVPWHIPSGLAFLLTVFVLAPLMGAFIERTLIRRVDASNVPVTLAITVGLTLFLIGGVSIIWPPSSRVVAQFFGNHGFNLFGVFVQWQELITVAAAIAIAIGLRLFLFQTRVGMAMRGVVDNRELVGLFGGRPASLSTLSWSIGASLASVAGILVAPRLQLDPIILTLLVIDAYAAAMVGRLRSLPMTFAGALAVGLLASYAVGYFPTSGGFWSSTPVQGLELSVPSVLLFIVLLVLPVSRLRSGVPQRKFGLAPAGLVRSLQGGALLVIATVVAVSVFGPGDVAKLGIGLASGLVCLSLVPLAGWGGQVSICQLTFAGLGAYAMYKFGSGGSILGLLAAAGLAGVVGGLVALPALRLRGLYLALATMAFASAMDNMFFPWSSVFGFNGSVHIARPTLFGLNVNTDKAFTVFLAVVFALLSIALLAMRRGKFGRVLIAMKDSEAACATLGLSLTRTKLTVFALSAAMAGLAGALLGGAESVVGGTNYEMFSSLLILAVVAIGGASLCSSALMGGLAIGFLTQNLQFLYIGGGTFLLSSYPEGVMPLIWSFRGRRRTGARVEPGVPPPDGEPARAGVLAGSSAV